MTIPFDQLLPPPFIPDATPGASTPTPTPTPPVTIPFAQLLPPPYIPDATPASPTPTLTPTPPPTIPFGPPTLPPFAPGATATPTLTPPTPTPTPALAPPAGYVPGPTPDPSAPPTFPILYHGALTVDGSPAPVGTRLYAKISKEGLPHVWDTWVTRVRDGRHYFPVSASGGYGGGTVEFWMEGRTRTTTVSYAAGAGVEAKLDLAF